jgi:hypothetical protein
MFGDEPVLTTGLAPTAGATNQHRWFLTHYRRTANGRLAFVVTYLSKWYRSISLRGLDLLTGLCRCFRKGPLASDRSMSVHTRLL